MKTAIRKYASKIMQSHTERKHNRQFIKSVRHLDERMLTDIGVKRHSKAYTETTRARLYPFM
jgi:uncharacterized protein YjiS (DUF1127 family)